MVIVVVEVVFSATAGRGSTILVSVVVAENGSDAVNFFVSTCSNFPFLYLSLGDDAGGFFAMVLPREGFFFAYCCFCTTCAHGK